ncbi:MAG: hypothetical protein DMF75_11400 [Acidobacteria bacterium]|nr:MAG: hypothetical protein DMF75_11400 [Acidobacteriota bacterium]
MNSATTENALQSSSQSDRQSLTAIFLVALIATGVVAPMFFLGNASGHDFQPHVAGWMDAAAQWREGILFPRWAQWANSGFGEPRFIFYPPGSWMLGAALGSVLPWKVVPGAFVWLTLIIAGISMWKFAGQWLSPTQAIAAALFFAANPYHLSLIFYRSAFAELLASALFPLMLLGTFVSNAPAGVIATYSLALSLTVSCIVSRTIRPLFLGGLSMLAGFGAAAFYLIPAWWEQRWVQIAQIVSTAYDPEKNFLFTRVNEPEFIQFNWKISAVALGLMLFTGLGISLSFRQRRAWPKVWWTLTVLSVACATLMLPPSAWLWRHLPKLRFLQFPWRWLLVLSFAFAFFGAAAGSLKRRVIWWAILITAICVTGTTIGGDTSWSSEDVSSVVEDISAGRGYEGIEGFEPLTAKVDKLDDELPLVGEYDPSSGDIDEPPEAQVNTMKWSAESKVFDVKSDEPVTLALKLLNYPAWQVQVDGNSLISSTVTQTGQLLVPLTAGSHHVEVEFRRTTDRTVGLFISVLSIVGLLIPAGIMLRRKE